jgi:hypothetical protein
MQPCAHSIVTSSGILRKAQLARRLSCWLLILWRARRQWSKRHVGMHFTTLPSAEARLHHHADHPTTRPGFINSDATIVTSASTRRWCLARHSWKHDSTAVRAGSIDQEPLVYAPVASLTGESRGNTCDATRVVRFVEAVLTIARHNSHIFPLLVLPEADWALRLFKQARSAVRSSHVSGAKTRAVPLAGWLSYVNFFSGSFAISSARAPFPL